MLSIGPGCRSVNRASAIMQYFIFLMLSPLTAIILVAAIVMVARRPRSGQSFPIASALWASLGFVVTNTLELVWPTAAGTMLFAKLGYLFSTPLPVFLFLFTLSFTGHENWLAPRRALPLFVVPFATTLLAVTEPLHGLIWAGITYQPIAGMLAMSVTYGWFYWIYFAYALALLIASAALILWEHAHAPRVYRAQSTSVMVGVLIPLAFYVVYTVKMIPGLTKNFSPIAFAAAGLFLAASLRRHSFLDLIPVARGVLVDEMADGMIIVDLDGRIVDANDAARQAFGVTENIIGGAIARLPGLEDVIGLMTADRKSREIPVGEPPLRRYYDAHVSPIANRRHEAIGSMILLRDVSETHALLEEKNRLIADLERAAGEIETLQGIIPICMYCKKIRDDAGYWHQVESYVSDHSRLQFSHGLCPDCERKHRETHGAAPADDS